MTRVKGQLGPNEALTRRRRSGCWTCKSRKMKCDELQPSCSTCRRLRMKCNYSIKLSWQDEATSGNMFLGRSGVGFKSNRRTRFLSSYDQRNADTAMPPARQHHFLPRASVENWMFLNVTYRDFEGNDNLSDDSDTTREDELALDSRVEFIPSTQKDNYWVVDSKQVGFASSVVDCEAFNRHGSLTFTAEEMAASFSLNEFVTSSPDWLEYSQPLHQACTDESPRSIYSASTPISQTIPGSPSILAFTMTERLLMDYFNNRIVRWCPGYGRDYVFQSIVLRLAVTTGSPMLLSMVLAVSANQLRILNHQHYEKEAWFHRGKGLKLLQQKITTCQRNHDWSGWEEIFATVILMCFFDVSDCCKSIWKSHLAFARNLRSWPRLSSTSLSPDQTDLFRFFSSYFSSHEVVARTAAELTDTPNYATFWVPEGVSMADVDISSGMSHELMYLISCVSDLGAEKHRASSLIALSPSHSEGLEFQRIDMIRRRDEIERKLHCLKQKPGRRPWDNHGVMSSRQEPESVGESKRLCALLYLYTRLDSAAPHHQHMTRLTSQVLLLLPLIGVATNTILWPLFIVGTMGVQNERDEDKKLVMKLFHDLQSTRQLGNVKRAKRIVEEVWRRRDIRGPDSVGWHDIQEIVTKQHGEISLM